MVLGNPKCNVRASKPMKNENDEEARPFAVYVGRYVHSTKPMGEMMNEKMGTV